jgi:hypothetical protein
MVHPLDKKLKVNILYAVECIHPSHETAVYQTAPILWSGIAQTMPDQSYRLHICLSIAMKASHIASHIAGEKKMKKRDQPTYSDLFEEFIGGYVPKPEEPPNDHEIWVSLHRFKIIDCMWFEGIIQKDFTKEFTYFINPDWPNPFTLPLDISGIMSLDEGQVIFIAERIEKPKWSRNPKADMGKVSIDSFKKIWKTI